jgi:hypothetical protein
MMQIIMASHFTWLSHVDTLSRSLSGHEAPVVLRKGDVSQRAVAPEFHPAFARHMMDRFRNDYFTRFHCRDTNDPGFGSLE